MFDVDVYASEYSGRTAITRLVAVSRWASLDSTRFKAAVLALAKVKKETSDVESYRSIFEDVKAVDNHDRSAVMIEMTNHSSDNKEIEREINGQLDDDWIDASSMHVRKENEKLEAEMRNYTVNLIKESIRLSYHAQADHTRSYGDMDAALKAYGKTRDYNSSPQHELDTTFGILEVALNMRAFSQIMPAVIKAEYAMNRLATSSGSLAAGGVKVASSSVNGVVVNGVVMTGAQARERDRRMAEIDNIGARNATKLKISKGIAFMNQGPTQWLAAAHEFTGILGKLEEWEGKVVSSSDVALYATLTSLATLDRKGVRSMLVDNPHIRQFMDYGSTAYTKELVHSYLHARYKDVSRILKENRERHLVDPFLRPNVALLEDAIWQNSLIQYLQPFANAEFSRMAEAFGIEDPEAKANIIAKVGELVNRERLQAKLDMVAEVVHMPERGSRQRLFRDAIQSGSNLHNTTRKSSLRMQLAEIQSTTEFARGQTKRKTNKKRQ